MLASFEKNNGENKNGPLDMLIAEISLWACRANYLLGLAVYVETSWGHGRFVHTHNVVARYVNAHLHSVSANFMCAETGREMEKLAWVKPAPVNPG